VCRASVHKYANALKACVPLWNVRRAKSKDLFSACKTPQHTSYYKLGSYALVITDVTENGMSVSNKSLWLRGWIRGLCVLCCHYVWSVLVLIKITLVSTFAIYPVSFLQNSSFVPCLFPNISQISGRQIIFTAVLNIINFPSSTGSIWVYSIARQSILFVSEMLWSLHISNSEQYRRKCR
jgi:hypothetical protein